MDNRKIDWFDVKKLCEYEKMIDKGDNFNSFQSNDYNNLIMRITQVRNEYNRLANKTDITWEEIDKKNELEDIIIKIAEARVKDLRDEPLRAYVIALGDSLLPSDLITKEVYKKECEKREIPLYSTK